MAVEILPVGTVTPLTGTHIVVRLGVPVINYLFSKDMGGGPANIKKRSGIVNVKVGDQSTTVPWATTVAGKLTAVTLAAFEDRVVYYGKRTEALPVHIEWFELDKTLDKTLDKIAQGLDTVGDAVGAVPVYGTAIKAGMKIVSAVLQLSRLAVDDDLELSVDKTFFGAPPSGGPGLAAGTWHIQRRNDAKPPDEPGLRLPIRIEDVTPAPPAAGKDMRRVQIVLSEIEIGPDAPPKGVLTIAWSIGLGKEIATGSRSVPLKNGKAGAKDVFQFGDLLLYDGPEVIGLPIKVTATVKSRVETSALLDKIKGVTDAVFDLSGAAIDGLNAEDRKKKADEIQGKVSKATETAHTIATALVNARKDRQLVDLDDVLLPVQAVRSLPSAVEGWKAFTEGKDEVVRVTIQVRTL